MARRIAAHWTRLALADAPSARSSHKISAIGGRGYLFGGEAVARQPIDSTVHCLDPTAGTWTRPAAAYGGGAPAAVPHMPALEAAEREPSKGGDGVGAPYELPFGITMGSSATRRLAAAIGVAAAVGFAFGRWGRAGASR